jgi:hypothetical protein
MRTLIVAKTVMGRAYCIGGWTEENQSVRLLLPGANCHPLSTRLNVGDIWDLELQRRPDVEPPHVEDVIITNQRQLGRVSSLRDTLLARVPRWEGSPAELYDRLLGWTSSGSGYVSRDRGIPALSTGFWIPDRDLSLEEDGKAYYHYPVRYGQRRLSYVGTEKAIDPIPAGTLVRVSLARWWAPDDSEMEPRCYLQLSGWYL